MIWVSLVGKLGFQTLRFQNYFFDLLISSIEYVACLEVLTMRLNAHSQPTVKAWISHKANAPHHAAKVCDVYNNTHCVCKIVQTAQQLLRLQQSPSISVTSCQRPGDRRCIARWFARLRCFFLPKSWIVTENCRLAQENKFFRLKLESVGLKGPQVTPLGLQGSH